MHLTSSPRRALGLLAAGTIGPSTALLGVTGVAQATPTAPPEAPTIDAIEGDDQTLHVFFLANFPAEDDVVTAWADSWEYNLDGDGWEAAVDVDISGGYGHFEVDGLTNDQEYSVEVRGVDGVLGVGAASEAEPGTPYKSIGAPGTPSVQVVGSSLTITWAAPTAGTYPLTGYRVGGYVSTVDGGGGEIELCRTGAAVLTCTIAVTPGNSYVVFVNAIDAEDHYGWESDPAASTGPIP